MFNRGAQVPGVPGRERPGPRLTQSKMHAHFDASVGGRIASARIATPTSAPFEVRGAVERATAVRNEENDAITRRDLAPAHVAALFLHEESRVSRDHPEHP